MLLLILPGCNPTKYVKSNELFVQKNQVKIDNRKIDRDKLESLIKQKPNRKILGLFRFHLGIYNLFKEESENKVKLNIGEAPVIYDQMLTERTKKQLKLHINNRGYFDNDISIETKTRKNRIKIKYVISAGKPYTIKSVDYIIEDTLMAKSSFSILKKTIVNLSPGNIFDIDALNNERERLKKEIRNHGYYYFNKDYIKYKVDSTIGNKEIAIKLYILNQKVYDPKGDSSISKPHEKFSINKINIYLSSDFQGENLNEFDTVNFKNIDVHHEDQLKYRPRMLNHAVNFNKGGLYLLTDQQNTYKHLSELRLFKNVNISFEDIGNNKLNTNIFLNPSLKKSFAVEGIGTNSGGNLGVEGNLIYQNKNIFRGGEHLTLKLNGGLEIQQLINEEENKDVNFLGVFNTLEFGPEINLEFPRFLLPIHLDKFSRRSNPKTNLNLLLNIQKRPEFLRNLTQITFGYFWNESNKKKHFINPINISVIDLTPTEAFQEDLNNEMNPFILNSYKDHFISSTSYSFLYNSQTLNKIKDFNYLKFEFEYAGISRTLFNNLIKTAYDNPETQSYNAFNIRYAQYLKADLDIRSYGQTKLTSFVKRINIGIGKPFGNLDVLPFEKSYYGGGANSIRAWQARSLGPGSLTDSLAKNSLNQIGELKIEGNLEYRFDITKLFEGAAFADAGNIWILSADENRPNAEIKANKFWKDIAIGVGIGLRMDFNFFLIRFDLAAKLKDPASINPEKIDLQWKSPTLNLGIGYPF